MRPEHVFTTTEIAAVRRGLDDGAAVSPGVPVTCCGRHSPADPSHGEPCALGTAFAIHLAALRRADDGPAPGPLRCCRRPAAVPADRTTLPHLMAVRDREVVMDGVIWETMDRREFQAWLPGADLPEAWLGRVDRLLALRAALREPAPSTGDVLADLRRLLGGGHFSMRFVLEHPADVARALDTLDDPAPAA